MVGAPGRARLLAPAVAVEDVRALGPLQPGRGGLLPSCLRRLSKYERGIPCPAFDTPLGCARVHVPVWAFAFAFSFFSVCFAFFSRFFSARARFSPTFSASDFLPDCSGFVKNSSSRSARLSCGGAGWARGAAHDSAKPQISHLGARERLVTDLEHLLNDLAVRFQHGLLLLVQLRYLWGGTPGV